MALTRKHRALAALVLGTALLPIGYAGFAQRAPDGESVDLAIVEPSAPLEADETTRAVADAAQAFLTTLSPEQRNAVVYALDDNAQRARWSNFPVNMVERGGIERGAMTDEQLAALDALLATVLSADGMRNVALQLEADDVLKREDDGGGRFPLDFGSEHYSIAFVGEPVADRPFTVQFGGHHLALNATFAGDRATFSPTLTGGQPLTLDFEGEDVFITRQETEAVAAFLASLDADQRAEAIRGDEPIELALGPGEHGTTVAPEGIQGSDLTEEQKALLAAVVEARVGQFNGRDAERTLTELREGIDEAYFAWWGPTEPLGAAYFRVTAPTLVMEYAPQEMGGDPTNHAHNMLRDPTNDYGAAWIAE